MNFRLDLKYDFDLQRPRPNPLFGGSRLDWTDDLHPAGICSTVGAPAKLRRSLFDMFFSLLNHSGDLVVWIRSGMRLILRLRVLAFFPQRFVRHRKNIN